MSRVGCPRPTIYLQLERSEKSVGHPGKAKLRFPASLEESNFSLASKCLALCFYNVEVSKNYGFVLKSFHQNLRAIIVDVMRRIRKKTTALDNALNNTSHPAIHSWFFPERRRFGSIRSRCGSRFLDRSCSCHTFGRAPGVSPKNP